MGRSAGVKPGFTLAGEVLLLLGITSVQLGADPDPTIQFLQPVDGAKLADESATIQVSYTGSAEEPIVRVEVYVEGGGPHFVYKPPRPEPQGTRSFSWALTQVAAGEHRLRARATDSAGGVASASITVNVDASQRPGPGPQRLEELRGRLPQMEPKIEIFRRYRDALRPELFSERGALWAPTDAPQRGGRFYWGPEGRSRCWYPVNPPRPIATPAQVRRTLAAPLDAVGGLIEPPRDEPEEQPGGKHEGETP